jgi:hypothetical protein
MDADPRAAYRFCFFTGPPGAGALAAPEIARAHSTSSVDAYFTSPVLAWAGPPSRPSSCDSIRTVKDGAM